MSSKLQYLMHRAFLNNSYDYGEMHEELKRAWMNSFSYLYTLQKTYIEYEELFFYSNTENANNSKKIGKLYLDKRHYANFDVDYELIHIVNREEYRLSKFYYKPASPVDIMDNPSIYLKMPVVLIDDQVIWDWTVTAKNDELVFSLPFKRKFVIQNARDPVTGEKVYIDHKIQVLMIDNIFYYRTPKINKYNIDFRATTGELFIPKSLVNNAPYEKPSTVGTMMCSFHFPNEYDKNYELGTCLIPLKDEGDKYSTILTKDLIIKLHQYTRNFYISFIYMNQLFAHEFYFGGNVTTVDDNGKANLMVLEKAKLTPFDMPVPTEDFMIFRQDNEDSGYYLVKNNETINLHYPNIYRFNENPEDKGVKYKVYYFYHSSRDLHYTILFDFYFRFLLNKFHQFDSLEQILDLLYRKEKRELDLEEYWNDEQIADFEEVFEKIFAYKYFTYKYGETDFILDYKSIEQNIDKAPFEYKDERMKEWIKVEPQHLHDYVLHQMKLGENYHLYTNQIDLQSRLRYDTSPEMGTKTCTFDEPRYVFAVQNERPHQDLLDMRVFVDGIYVMPLYQERKLFMDYIYIPADMVTHDSYIEIEVFPRFRFRQKMTFESMDDLKEVNLGLENYDEKIWPTLADLYFTWDPYPRVRLDEEYFDIFHFQKDTGEFLVDRDRGEFWAWHRNEHHTEPEDRNVEFTRLNKFKIKPNVPDICGKELELHFDKVSHRIFIHVQEDGHPFIKFTEKDWMFNYEYIRIFVNGRLMPRCKYQFNDTFAEPTLIFFDDFNRGDTIMIDIGPYRYHEVYYQEYMNIYNPTINLKGIINKPFDIRYYDVYVNGRKMSLNNVFAISPYVISFVNLKSFYNIEIFERERDGEYFGLDYTKPLYYYNFENLINETFVLEEDKIKLIKDKIDSMKDDRLNIYPNEQSEETQNREDLRAFYQFFIYYRDQLIPKQMYNPTALQENTELMRDNYSELYAAYKQRPKDEARTKREFTRKFFYPSVISHDPDITIGNGNPNNKFYVYPLGLLDETLPIDMEEYLNDDAYKNEKLRYIEKPPIDRTPKEPLPPISKLTT